MIVRGAIDVKAQPYVVPRSSPRYGLAPTLISFGAAVREARLDRGLTQEALAHDAGMDRSYMSSIERGTQNVSLVLAIRLAGALGMSLADLASRAQL